MYNYHAFYAIILVYKQGDNNMAYKTGDRYQMNLFPPVIDDYVAKDDLVRVYDAFVDSLNFKELGIPVAPYKSGAHEYCPKKMLKLIIYGYSYGTRSSRKLERNCHHNLSFVWLMGGLKPDYRTIARFRSDHAGAIKRVLKQCVRLCINLDLIEGNTLFTDGSSFRASASIRRTWTQERCKEHLERLDTSIEKLVDETGRLDISEENLNSLVKINKELLDKERIRAVVKDISKELDGGSKASLNTTDPDCVKTKSRQGTHAGYNAQITTDKKHGLIVNSETASSSQDYNQLSIQVEKAALMLEHKPKTIVTDCGYYSLKDIAKIDNDITVVMPSIKQAQENKGLHPLKPFIKERFTYDTSQDKYICPEGKDLVYARASSRGKKIYQSDSSICRSCRHFGVCTSSLHGRVITRMAEENVASRLSAVYHSPEGQKVYKLRKEKAELPFGHIKHNLGAGQFMLRTRPKVDAELSILSTCFNVARMITIIGIPTLLTRLQGTG
jgi:transposase